MRGEPGSERYEGEDFSDLIALDLPFDVRTAHPTCLKCVRRQLDKYKNEMVGGKSLADKFQICCKGIPKDPIPLSVRKMYSPEEVAELERIYDPVKWAAHYLKQPNNKPWVAREYQAEILRCTGDRRVIRIARRTGKTDVIAVEVLWKMFRQGSRRIIIAGPQKVHVDLIFKRIRGFMSRSPILANAITKNISSPIHELRLNNESYVMGFAVGTKGNTEGVSVRGQDGDDVYVDETAYVDTEAMQGAVLPILQTTDSTTMAAFSTPTGFKDVYYSMCLESVRYREFHYNYKILDHWRRIEGERSQYPQAKWEHEILAEFGSSDEGVYKPSYVDRAIETYSYAEQHPDPRCRYIVGVDWNEKHGAEIAVVSQNKITGMHRVVEAYCVEKADFTQLAGVQAVVEINRKWKPVYIYIDAGGGSTNYDLLRKLSYEARGRGSDPDTARILDILKKYDSGSSIQAKDPVTGEPQKQPAKPYMINASVRVFENGLIEISAEDKVLEAQLRNYIIERFSPTGNPVYGLKDKKVLDHRLDAFNLAMVAFHIEFGELRPKLSYTKMLAAPSPMQKVVSSQRSGVQREAYTERNIERVIERSPTGHGGVTLPAVIDRPRVSSSRPGWDSDLEDVYERRYQQRKRSFSRRKDARRRIGRSNI